MTTPAKARATSNPVVNVVRPPSREADTVVTRERGELRALSASALDLDALLPVLGGDVPLVMSSDRAGDILALIELAQEMGDGRHVAILEPDPDDGHEQRWVKTLRGRGFHFVGQLEEDLAESMRQRLARLRRRLASDGG